MAGYRIALVGATGLVGEAILNLLQQRSFPIADLQLLASDESEGKRLEFAGQHHRVKVVREFDYQEVDLVFMAVPAAVAREEIPRARAAGCRIIDLSPALRGDADVPLVVAGFNDHLITGQTDIVATPSADVIFLAHLLPALASAGTLSLITGSVQRSAALLGANSVQELASQSIALFNMKEAPVSSLGCKQAFNVVDLQELPSTSDGRQEFGETARQCGRLDPDLADKIALQHNLVPVFHGLMLNLSIIYDGKTDDRALIASVNRSEYLQLASDKDKLHDLSILTYGSGTDFVYIGTIRPLTGTVPGFLLTMIGDGIRAGVARNAVELGEAMLNPTA